MGNTAGNPSLPAFPSADHGNMKAASLQMLLLLLWALCLLALAAGEPQLPLLLGNSSFRGMAMGPGRGKLALDQATGTSVGCRRSHSRIRLALGGGGGGEADGRNSRSGDIRAAP